MPNSSIAQGSFFSIYGVGIGPSTPVGWNPYPLPLNLGGVTLSVAGISAYPEYVSSGQVNAVMPSNVPTGNQTLTLTFNGSSTTFAVTVVASSFGTFTWTGAGSGPGILTNAVTYGFITPFATIKPGDYVTIWGTGIGAVPDPVAEQNAAPVQTNLCGGGSTCPVTVWVGTQTATVTYAGRSGFTAVDQIDFIVPTGPTGCYVQVAVQIGSVVSNFTSMSVDPNGAACQDADGINMNDISSAVSSKGSANVGAVSLLSNYLDLSIAGLGTFQWDNDTVNGEIGTFSAYALEAFQGFALAPSVNECTVSSFLQYPPPQDPILSSTAVTYLDAGANLTTTGPNPAATEPLCPSISGCVPKNANGKGYSALAGGATINNLLQGQGVNPFYLNPAGWGGSSWTYAISPGTYTVAGPGGSNVGAFSDTITVSQADSQFKWTNQAALTSNPITRSSGMQVTWTGGDGYVDITAVSSTLQSGLTPSPTTPGILVECIAPASQGSFTVPSFVLASLPSTVSSTAAVPPGELLVGPASPTVKATNVPTGLDALYIFYHFIEGANVSWQ